MHSGLQPGLVTLDWGNALYLSGSSTLIPVFLQTVEVAGMNLLDQSIIEKDKEMTIHLAALDPAPVSGSGFQ